MNNTVKREINLQWIKADSGTTYLCPLGALSRIDILSGDVLQKMCVDESKNPQKN